MSGEYLLEVKRNAAYFELKGLSTSFDMFINSGHGTK